jgi:hypothetical protein
MKTDDTTHVRLYQLKQCAVAKFIHGGEESPALFSAGIGDDNSFFDFPRTIP